MVNSIRGSARTTTSEMFSAAIERLSRLPVAPNSSTTSHWNATSAIAIIGQTAAKRFQAEPWSMWSPWPSTIRVMPARACHMVSAIRPWKITDIQNPRLPVA